MDEKTIHIDTINGDFCLHKFVYNADSRAADDAEVEVVSTQPNEVDEVKGQSRAEDRFHFVHPELDDEEAWRIHDAVKRLVAHQKVKEICMYLKDLKKDKKVLLPQSPSVAYAELVRMGMPNGDGFSEKNFSNSYLK